MKKFLIAGNWKMNMSISETREFAAELKLQNLAHPEEIAIMSPFTDLAILKEELADEGVKIGAQNVHYEKSGAFTGEISVPMLKELGIDMCIVGHSERRQYFAETDESINLKIKALLEAGITPILCVGESLALRDEGNAMAFVSGQLSKDLEGLTSEQISKIVIAYEPIWAIGTGKTATPDQAEEMCAFIRGMIEGLFGLENADELIILYGGSMKPNNAKELLEKQDINGGLIGGASLKVESLKEIAETAFGLQ